MDNKIINNLKFNYLMKAVKYKMYFSALFLLCVLFAIGCTGTKKEQPSQKTEIKEIVFDEQAHRGGRGLMPENTIPAMLDAIDRGVSTLEMDLQITKDKKVIVSHDPYFNMDITTLPDGTTIATKDDAKKLILYTMDYDSIKKYDVGIKGNPHFPEQKKIKAVKPLLIDLIKASEDHAQAKGKTMLYNIEIKSKVNGDNTIHPPVTEFVDLAMKVINESGIQDRVTIQSFDVRALQYMHRNYPDVTLSYLIGKKENKPVDELFKKLGFTPQILSPEYVIVTDTMIRNCHDMNVKVIPWTINDKDEIKKQKEMGVDGIITDYPNLFETIR